MNFIKIISLTCLLMCLKAINLSMARSLGRELQRYLQSLHVYKNKQADFNCEYLGHEQRSVFSNQIEQILKYFCYNTQKSLMIQLSQNNALSGKIIFQSQVRDDIPKYYDRQQNQVGSIWAQVPFLNEIFGEQFFVNNNIPLLYTEPTIRYTQNDQLKIYKLVYSVINSLDSRTSVKQLMVNQIKEDVISQFAQISQMQNPKFEVRRNPQISQNLINIAIAKREIHQTNLKPKNNQISAQEFVLNPSLKGLGQRIFREHAKASTGVEVLSFFIQEFDYVIDKFGDEILAKDIPNEKLDKIIQLKFHIFFIKIMKHIILCIAISLKVINCQQEYEDYSQKVYEFMDNLQLLKLPYFYEDNQEDETDETKIWCKYFGTDEYKTDQQKQVFVQNYVYKIGQQHYLVELKKTQDGLEEIIIKVNNKILVNEEWLLDYGTYFMPLIDERVGNFDKLFQIGFFKEKNKGLVYNQVKLAIQVDDYDGYYTFKFYLDYSEEKRDQLGAAYKKVFQDYCTSKSPNEILSIIQQFQQEIMNQQVQQFQNNKNILKRNNIEIVYPVLQQDAQIQREVLELILKQRAIEFCYYNYQYYNQKLAEEFAIESEVNLNSSIDNKIQLNITL